MTMDLKPYLLIDVDGVLAPVVAGAGPPGFLRHTVRAQDGREHEVWLNPDHGSWLNVLAQRFELVWATGWEHDAPRLLGPLLRLPPMAVIEFTQRPVVGDILRKLPDVIDFVGDEPAAWIDDDLDREAEVWAGQRPAPTLLIKPDRAAGLASHHVAQLDAFSDQIQSRS